MGLISLTRFVVSMEQHGIVFRVAFPARQNDVAIAWVDLAHECPSAGLMRRNQRRAAAAEKIENDTAAKRHP